MTKFKFISVLLSIIITLNAFADEYRGKDLTPKQIQKKYYTWSKEAKEPTSDKDPANIWFNSYSNTMEGYIILLSGEKIKGKITVRHRWNLASKKKLKEQYTTSEGVKATRMVKNPKGVDIILEVKIVSDSETKTIPTTEILAYGPYFKKADWSLVGGQKADSEKYLQGVITNVDGTSKEGFLTLNTHSFLKRKFDLRYFDYIFFSENESANAELIYSEDLKEVTQSSTLYVNYRNKYLINRDLLISSLETDASKLKHEDLQPGSILTNEGEEIKGRIATQKDAKIQSTGGTTTVMGKEVQKVAKSKHIIFIDEQKNIQYISVSNNNIIYFVLGGQEFYAVDGNFVSRDQLNLESGKMVYKNASEIEGLLTFRNNYFLYDDGGGKLTSITVKNANDLDYVMLGEGDSLRKVILVEETERKYFIEVKYPGGKYSYYKNPNPTNKRSGASLLTSMTASAGAIVAEHTLDQTESEGDISDLDLDIYFREWIVMNNRTGEKLMVFKKNLNEQKNKLMSGCQRMSVDNRNIIKNISKVNEIDLLVKTMNQCAD